MLNSKYACTPYQAVSVGHLLASPLRSCRDNFKLRNNVTHVQDELEDLEETLCDSIRDSLATKNRTQPSHAAPSTDQLDTAKAAAHSDSDDEFFDRTAKAPRRGKAGATRSSAAAGGGKEESEVLTVAELVKARVSLSERVAVLQREVEKEE